MSAGTNTDATFEVLLAIAAAGCIACPLNTRWSDRDVQHAIQLTSPVLLFVEPGLEAVAKSCLAVNPEIRIVPIMTHGGQQYASFKDVPQRALLSTTSQLIAKHRGAPLRLQRPDCGTALICFTSGTTAAAKGVRISHSALVVQSLIKLAMVAYSRDDVYLHVAPLFHIGTLRLSHPTEKSSTDSHSRVLPSQHIRSQTHDSTRTAAHTRAITQRPRTTSSVSSSCGRSASEAKRAPYIVQEASPQHCQCSWLEAAMCSCRHTLHPRCSH